MWFFGYGICLFEQFCHAVSLGILWREHGSKTVPFPSKCQCNRSWPKSSLECLLFFLLLDLPRLDILRTKGVHLAANPGRQKPLEFPASGYTQGTNESRLLSLILFPSLASLPQGWMKWLPGICKHPSVRTDTYLWVVSEWGWCKWSSGGSGDYIDPSSRSGYRARSALRWFEGKKSSSCRDKWNRPICRWILNHYL